MSTKMVQLKKALKEGHGFISQEYGGNNTLYDVLLALSSMRLSGGQATAAAATIASMVADAPMTMKQLSVKAIVAGTASATTVKVQKNGADVAGATLTIDNADADGILKTLPLAVDVAAGDLITLVVSAAATGATGLGASLLLGKVDTST